MKDIIFLGGLFPKELRKEIEKKTTGTIDYAADTLQWALIEGLDCHTNSLRIINLPFINIFPYYSDILIKTFSFSHNQISNDINVGFLNFPILKKISRYLNTKSKLKTLISDENQTILIYSLHVPFIKAAIEVKKKYSSKVCVIVPDLMQFTSEESRWELLRFINNKEKLLLENLLKKVDGFIILSDLMYEPLKIKTRPWVRVEGIFNSKDIAGLEKKESLKTILYSGTLARRYGILNLLDAFSNIKAEGYRLWICGNGDTSDEIHSRAKNDNRITYFGQIPREEVLKLQKRATILVNPRTSQEFTKYSFPSKIMEYLGSGTPCIMHRLPGIPTEYYQYVFVPEDETVEGLEKCIVESCNKNDLELNKFGERAKNFVLNFKSPAKQCEKIFDLIQSL